MVPIDVSGVAGESYNTELIDITFVLTTYNHANVVLQALESIKYQLVHYRRDEKIQLIITDDGSTDGTTDVIKKWLSINNNRFDEICELYSMENRGTCKSVASAYRQIRGKYVYSMSGDDILMNTNLIERLKRVDANEVVLCPPLKFCQDLLITDLKDYYGDLRSAFYSRKDIINRSRFSCPIVNGSLIGRDFYNERAYSFSENFVLLDDRARFMDCFSHIKKFKLSYSDRPVLLYRRSDTQITCEKGVAHQQIVNDIQKMAQIALHATKNPLLKLRIKIEKMKEINYKSYKQTWKYIDIWLLEDIYLFKIKKNKMFKLAQDMVSYGEKQNVNEYMRRIRHSAGVNRKCDQKSLL